MGFLGRGQPAPLHQLGGLRERSKLPQLGPGRSSGRRRVFLYSEPSIAFPSISVRVAYSWDIHINIPIIVGVSDSLHTPASDARE